MKQDRVSRSSAEAEYCEMADTVSELIWICELLPAFGIDCSAPITLHSDSLYAINLAANPVYHACMKHVSRDVHFICDDHSRFNRNKTCSYKVTACRHHDKGLGT